MAGTAFGETNDTASILETPVADSASISRARSSTGSGRSDWRPSRGPTSRIVTRDGRSGRIPCRIRAGPRRGRPSPALPLRGALLVERGDALPAVPRGHGASPRQVLQVDP